MFSAQTPWVVFLDNVHLSWHSLFVPVPLKRLMISVMVCIGGMKRWKTLSLRGFEDLAAASCPNFKSNFLEMT